MRAPLRPIDGLAWEADLTNGVRALWLDFYSGLDVIAQHSIADLTMSLIKLAHAWGDRDATAVLNAIPREHVYTGSTSNQWPPEQRGQAYLNLRFGIGYYHFGKAQTFLEGMPDLSAVPRVTAPLKKL